MCCSIVIHHHRPQGPTTFQRVRWDFTCMQCYACTHRGPIVRSHPISLSNVKLSPYPRGLQLLRQYKVWKPPSPRWLIWAFSLVIFCYRLNDIMLNIRITKNQDIFVIQFTFLIKLLNQTVISRSDSNLSCLQSKHSFSIIYCLFINWFLCEDEMMFSNGPRLLYIYMFMIYF